MYRKQEEKKSFFRLITLKIPGVSTGNKGTTFSFPDIGDLRYARTQSVEIFFAEDLAYAFPEAVPVVPISYLPIISLVLNTNDPEKTNQGADGRFTSTVDSQRWLPAAAIHRVNSNGTSPYVYDLASYHNLWITWEKSFIQLAPNGLNNTRDQAIVLGVWYTFFNIEGKEVRRT